MRRRFVRRHFITRRRFYGDIFLGRRFVGRRFVKESFCKDVSYVCRHHFPAFLILVWAERRGDSTLECTLFSMKEDLARKKVNVIFRSQKRKPVGWPKKHERF